MTFNEWWEKYEIEQGYKKGSVLKLKELSRLAWNASRNCSKCGRNLQLPVCPQCGNHEVENY